jgi:chemotaxis protein methyltransferase CheR
MIAITDGEFKQFSDFIKSRYGIHLKPEKKALLAGRLQQVLAEQRFSNFTDYFHHLMSDSSGAAISLLADKITTNHTFFMREASHFQFFKDRVLPGLSQTIRNRDVRIWCAGCSTGEEAYTLAFLLDERFRSEQPDWDTRVLATDISSKALETAVQGSYPDKSLETLPSAWRSVYFRKGLEGHSVVSDAAKRAVIFRRFNLMQPAFPFKRKFHAIFCRNVMIYFDERTKADLIRKFYEHTEPGGYLFIGHSESLERDGTGYRYVMPSVYRKDG